MSKIVRLKIIRAMMKKAGYLTNLVDDKIKQLKDQKENKLQPSDNKNSKDQF